MKRVLLATTALGMSAGVAFAQDMGMADDGMMMEPASSVTVSGDGRMGVVSDKEDNLKFSSRVRVKFALAATLDSGLSAGGSIRADNASGGASGTGGSIYLSGPFGKLSMGDVDPGAKAAIGHVSSVGYVNQGDPNEITYLRGGGDPTLQYMLPKMGPVQVYASVGMVTTDVKDEDGDQVYVKESYALNAKTGVIEQTKKTMTEVSADTLSVGAKADLAIADMGTAWIGGGFEATTSDTEDGHLVLGAGVSASGFIGTVVVGMQGRDTNDAEGDPIEVDEEGNAINRDREQFAVSAGYSAGQMGVTVFYTDDTDYDGAEALGAGFSWNLGGGASLEAGFTNWPGQKPGDEDQQTADLGVTFAF